MNEKPNILLIVLDSARPESLEPYSDKANTPNILKLAEEGIVYENAYAAGPNTPPSHAAIFSGQRPSEVGALPPEPELNCEETIADMLSEDGYFTSGIHGAAHIDGSGFSQGFDEYLDIKYDFSRFSLNPFMMLDTVLNRIWGRRHRIFFQTHIARNRIEEEKPLFMFLNYQNVHRPYANPPIWIRKNYSPFRLTKNLNNITRKPAGELSSNIDISEQEREILFNRQRAETERTDFYIGQLVKKLKKEGKYENSVIIVTSDHGDEFGENGYFEHQQLTKPVLNVPLIIGGGAVERNDRVEQKVSLTGLKGFIEKMTQGKGEDALNFLRAEYVTSEKGLMDSEPEVEEEDAAISVINQVQFIKRMNFESEFYSLEQKRESIEPPQRSEKYEKEAGDFEKFGVKGDRYSNMDDEKVKEKLEELGYI